MEEHNYRQILYNEFLTRKNARKDFSYNSFARYIGLASSHFNDILKDRRGLSVKKARMICDILDLSERTEELFMLSVTAGHSRSRKERETALERLEFLKNNQVQILEDAFFNVIADWSHFAILELSRTPGFQMDDFWVAQKLNISTLSAEKALKRLIKLKLLQKEDGKWRAHKGLLQTKDDIPSLAIKKHHQQILELSLAALQAQKPQEREYQATMMTINRDQLGEAKELIREFKKKFCNELTTQTPDYSKESVYCLATQFFFICNGDIQK